MTCNSLFSTVLFKKIHLIYPTRNPPPPQPDLSAPGVAIIGPAGGATQTVILDGTSQAAPHVAGVAALCLSVIIDREGPEGGYNRGAFLKEILKNSVDPIPALEGKVVTGGRVNAGRAVELVL